MARTQAYRRRSTRGEVVTDDQRALLAAMKVHDRPYLGFGGFRAVKCVVHSKNVLVRQFIRPLH